MSLSDIRPYFRSSLESLNFHEWPDGFNSDNIPNVILDRAYHLEQGSITGESLDHDSTDLEVGITVRIFIRGFNDPGEAIDQSMTEVQDIISTILNPSDRLGETFKNIEVVTVDIEPISDTNDNVVVGVLNFVVTDVIAFS